MKKSLITLAVMLAAGIGAAQAQTQLPADSWAAGIGLSYPRYASVNIDQLNSDLGGYISIQRNFTEHLGLRLKAGFSHLEGQYTDASASLINESTNLITADLDVLFYPVPCDIVSPYIFGGVGANYKMFTNPQTVIPDANKAGAQLNIGAGMDFKLAPEINLVTEFGYHITDGSSLDGTIVPTEINVQDSYLAFTAGVNFVFGKGEPSKICDSCGQSEPVSQAMKDRIAYNSRVVDRYILSIANDKLVLVGVNFGFDESTLLPESYAVLDKTVKILNDKPGIKIQIIGYTDYMGSADYNLNLAEARAKTVKDYFVSKGVAADRIAIIANGQGGATGDNKTAEGREMNRRIVIRIVK
jgi:outer membrane protein OmpA-like peptidoglycan-associated protein/opacity protein-like surface antigen